jgi:hypothetical protein
VEDPDIAGAQVGIEELAGTIPSNPQRLRCVVHVGLAFQQPLVLDSEDGQDELALRAEVIVDLAERHAGRSAHAPGREAA